jgi:hypothetical protein
MPEPDDKSRLFAQQFGLTTEPVDFVQTLGLAYCSREPCRSSAVCLEPGAPVRLCRDPAVRRESLSVRVSNPAGCTVGYLYAADGYLAILLDTCRRLAGLAPAGAEPEVIDRSIVATIVRGPDANQPESQRLRYPKICLQIRLRLRQAWPLWTIMVLLHLKEEPALLPLIRENLWLAPLLSLHDAYRRQSHDGFVLPPLLAEAWLELTGPERSVPAEMEAT